MSATAAPSCDLSGKDHWIFDLDNTLYPPTCRLFDQIDKRMGAFITDLLDLAPVEARALQKRYFREYGTTLSGLMTHHNMEPTRYLAYVHDIDYSVIPADPALAGALERLPGRKLIFTNGSRAHALNVMSRLGIAGQFDHVHDITDSDYVPKPMAQAYERLIAGSGADPARSAMFEDIAHNLEVAHGMGMATVLVRPENGHPDAGHIVTGNGSEPYVDCTTTDLNHFLTRLTA
jgi:putative hydrolase of the HAD superfamily